MMTFENRWFKGLIVSVFIHGMVIVIVGFMGTSLLYHAEDPETMVEIDLTGGAQSGESGPKTGNHSPDRGFQSGTRVLSPQPVEVNPLSPSVKAPLLAEKLPSPESVPADQEKIKTEPIPEVYPSAVNPVTGQENLALPDKEIRSVTSVAMSANAYGNSTGNNGSSTAGGDGGPGGNGDGNGGNGRAGVAPPMILSKVEPLYPYQYREAGNEGKVVLKTEILENGRPGRVYVLQSSGYELLDKAALAAIKRWRFVPAQDRKSGRLIRSYLRIPINFRLEKAPE